MGIDLAVVWAIIIFFGVFMYVVMDGFDLGIGMQYPFVPERHDRDVMINTVAPVWDGNETWLVLGGAAMLAAFPLAYSIILAGLYLPLIFMLLGLIFRLGQGLHRRLGDGDVFPERGAGRLPVRDSGRGAGLRRRAARLTGAVSAAQRSRGRDCLDAARQHLADHEDRGRRATAHDPRSTPFRADAARRHRTLGAALMRLLMQAAGLRQVQAPGCAGPVRRPQVPPPND